MRMGFGTKIEETCTSKEDTLKMRLNAIHPPHFSLTLVKNALKFLDEVLLIQGIIASQETRV